MRSGSYPRIVYVVSKKCTCHHGSYVFLAQENCLLTNGSEGLPPFHGYNAGPERRIYHQHQAIIPTYKFNCCGNITTWGVDLNPVHPKGVFDFDLQVWRPSPTKTECYSLVDNYEEKLTMLPQVTTDHVAKVTPSPHSQLQFKPGDVLGFYVESSGAGSDDDNGVVLLNDHHHTSELVWHASIQDRSSLSGSCPYAVGTDGVLTMSTHAAPVISISATTYLCPQSSNTLVSNAPIPSSVYLTVKSGGLPTQTPTTVFVDYTTASGTSINVTSAIIAAIVVAVMLLCGIPTLLIMIIAILVSKCRSSETSFPSVDTSTAVSNLVYGKSPCSVLL